MVRPGATELSLPSDLSLSFSLERPRLGLWVEALPVDSKTRGSQEPSFRREEGWCAKVRW